MTFPCVSIPRFGNGVKVFLNLLAAVKVAIRSRSPRMMGSPATGWSFVLDVLAQMLRPPPGGGCWFWSLEVERGTWILCLCLGIFTSHIFILGNIIAVDPVDP